MRDTHTARCLVETIHRGAPASGTSLEAKPFLTISRQYGCGGFALALKIQALLGARGGPPWTVYSKEIIRRLAKDMQSTTAVVQRERRRGSEPLAELIRALSSVKTPSGREIRYRTAMLIHHLAAEGEAIIVGLGGAAATRAMPNGLAVRLEAPTDWRVRQVVLREGIDEKLARSRLAKVEREREYLHALYARWFPRKPAFHLTFDASVFALEDIAQQVTWMLGRMRPETPPV